MGIVSVTPDPNWPSASSLLSSFPIANRRNAGLLGIPTFATSVTARSTLSAPTAIRLALERYSTWSYSDQVDLAEVLCLVDYGDVRDPDGDGGAQRVADSLAGMDPSLELRIILGGDNAATWHALRALAGDDLSQWGLITLDAHHDLRDGRSNGSPVRQLLDEGLDARHVVQVAWPISPIPPTTPWWPTTRASPSSRATPCALNPSRTRPPTRWWWPAPEGVRSSWTSTWTPRIVPWCRPVRRPRPAG